MDYKEFADSMQKDLTEQLKGVIPNVAVRQSSVEKLQNESYRNLEVTDGGRVSLSINMNALYQHSDFGGSYEGALDEAVNIVENHFKDAQQMDVDVLTNYEQAKHMLCMEVVDTERNADMLAHIPHTEAENLSLVYRIQLESSLEGTATVLVTNSLMEKFGITQEQLHADAMKSAPLIRPASLKRMAEVMSEMTGMAPEELLPDNGPQMYVLTNSAGMRGAAAAFYPDMMEKAEKELGGSFFLLPSSVYEVLLVPDQGIFQIKELEAMVQDINASQVRPEEQLSDHVYRYDADSRTFELGASYETRREEKQNKKPERNSVLKKLQSKSVDMDLKPKAAVQKSDPNMAL